MNLYEISEEHLNILRDIEEQEGILDEELEERLKISEENFKQKAEAYCKMIAILDGDKKAGLAEIERINKYVKVKGNTISRLQENLLSALALFGTKDAKKDIWRFEVGNFKLGTRKSISTIVDEDEIEDRFKEISISKLTLEDKVKILDALGVNEDSVKITVSVPKTPIKEAIENGEEVKGAYLSTNYSLNIT